MKLDSKYFDRIRIKPDNDPTEAERLPACGWDGCGRPAAYRAPKGRRREGEYHNFCLDHVRLYNKSYNYFAGMGDDDIAEFQRSSVTGHRPTWRVGVNPGRAEAEDHGRAPEWSFSDPFGLFGQGGGRTARAEEVRRPLKKLERKSFLALDLEGHETGTEIKARYKMLVKRLHPDANGGDRSSEDKLSQIIQAYAYLKSAGFC
jgi:DnaJ domain